MLAKKILAVYTWSIAISFILLLSSCRPPLPISTSLGKGSDLSDDPGRQRQRDEQDRKNRERERQKKEEKRKKWDEQEKKTQKILQAKGIIYKPRPYIPEGTPTISSTKKPAGRRHKYVRTKTRTYSVPRSSPRGGGGCGH